MPLCYGGGVSSIEQMRGNVRARNRRTLLNTAALDDLSLLIRGGRPFRYQSVVFSNRLQAGLVGGASVYSHAGRKVTSRIPLLWRSGGKRRGRGRSC